MRITKEVFENAPESSGEITVVKVNHDDIDEIDYMLLIRLPTDPGGRMERIEVLFDDEAEMKQMLRRRNVLI